MNNHLIILGIAVLLICVGLSGCEELSIQTNGKALTVDELLDNKLKYHDKEVVVEGYIKKEIDFTYNFSDICTSMDLYDVSGTRYVGLGWAFQYKTPETDEQKHYFYITPDNAHVIVRGIYDKTIDWINFSSIERLD